MPISKTKNAMETVRQKSWFGWAIHWSFLKISGLNKLPNGGSFNSATTN